MNNPLPEIYISAFLYDQLVDGAIRENQPNAPLEFVDRFRKWIAIGKVPNDFFGADRPPRGDYIWHVHIAPTSNTFRHEAWKLKVKAGQAPTSNGTIIYATDQRGKKHFLIANFVEPTGHDLWKRSDPEAVEAKDTFIGWAKNFYTFSHESKYALSHAYLVEDLKRIKALIASSQTQMRSGTNNT